MYVVRLLVVAFLLLFMQAAWMPSLRVAGVEPDLLLGLLFTIGLRRGMQWAVWSGLFLGLLVDIEQPERLGLDSIAYVVTGLVIVAGSRQIDKANPPVLVILLFLSAVVAETIRMLGLAEGVASFFHLELRFALLGALYTTLFLPCLAWAAARLLGRREWFLGAA